MAGPPAHIAARRALRRAEVRRRRMLALVAAVVVCAPLAVVVASSGGSRSSSPHGNPSAGTRSTHGVGRHQPNRAAGASTGRGVVANSGSGTVARLARLGLPMYCAGRRGNAVAFTFDDGPGPYTPLALRKLRAAHEHATFFVVGRSIDRFPGHIASEMRVAAIGDHSYTHPLLSALPAATVNSELARTLARIKRDAGIRSRMFRPPYGARNATVDQVAKSLGMLEIVWNVDSADSLGANYAQIIKNVEAGMRPGAIILMHENRGQTIRALTTLLPELHRRHLRSLTVPELLAQDPPSLAQLRRGRSGCAG